MKEVINKTELVKILVGDKFFNKSVESLDITVCIESDRDIEWNFCGGLTVYVHKEDFSKDKLDIQLSDLEKDEDAKICIKQVEDLLWERAADKYLEIIHNAIMMIGGK